MPAIHLLSALSSNRNNYWQKNLPAIVTTPSNEWVEIYQVNVISVNTELTHRNVTHISKLANKTDIMHCNWLVKLKIVKKRTCSLGHRYGVIIFITLVKQAICLPARCFGRLDMLPCSWSFVTSFTDRYCSVFGLALTVSYKRNNSIFCVAHLLCIQLSVGAQGHLYLQPCHLLYHHESSSIHMREKIELTHQLCLQRKRQSTAYTDRIPNTKNATALFSMYCTSKTGRKPFGIQPHTAPCGTTTQLTGNMALIKTLSFLKYCY